MGDFDVRAVIPFHSDVSALLLNQPNLRTSEHGLLYSAIFVACLLRLPHTLPKQYYSTQSEVVLMFGILDAGSPEKPVA